MPMISAMRLRRSWGTQLLWAFGETQIPRGNDKQRSYRVMGKTGQGVRVRVWVVDWVTAGWVKGRT